MAEAREFLRGEQCVGVREQEQRSGLKERGMRMNRERMVGQKCTTK